MKILVAVDRSPESADAAETAKELFGADHQFTFMSVLEYETTDSGTGTGKPPSLSRTSDQVVDDAIATAAEVAIDQATSLAVDKPNIAVEIGPIGPAICELALEIGAEVVVIGSKERSIWSRIFDTSAVRHLIDHCPCPVLVVR